MKCDIILFAFFHFAIITHAAIIRSGETYESSFQGYHIDPPLVPFELPNEISRLPAVVTVSLPPPTEVEQNFVHQELGSQQKGRRRGSVKRLKLHKHEESDASCTGRDIETVVAERVKNRPRLRLRHPYTETVANLDFFLQGPDENKLQELQEEPVVASVPDPQPELSPVEPETEAPQYEAEPEPVQSEEIQLPVEEPSPEITYNEPKDTEYTYTPVEPAVQESEPEPVQVKEIVPELEPETESKDVSITGYFLNPPSIPFEY